MTVTSKWVALHEVSDYLAKGWREVKLEGGLRDAVLMVSPEEPASEGGKVEPFCRYCAGYAVAAGERHHSYTCNRPRHQDKPAKVRMTEELETVLAVAEQAEVHFRTGFTMLSPRSLSDIRVAIAAVRAQAAEAGKETEELRARATQLESDFDRVRENLSAEVAGLKVTVLKLEAQVDDYGEKMSRVPAGFFA